jgi:hypothetical protein
MVTLACTRKRLGICQADNTCPYDKASNGYNGKRTTVFVKFGHSRIFGQVNADTNCMYKLLSISDQVKQENAASDF